MIPGHRLKLRRAYDHLQWMRAYLQPWVEGDNHTEWLEPDPERPNWIQLMASLSDEPSVDPLSLVLGECLHNMRSALDLLAFELAAAYTKPLPRGCW